MEGVELSVRKASRFIDNLIRVVTFISFLLFAGSFYIYHYKSGEIYKNQIVLCDAVWTQGQTQENPLDNPIHESLLVFKNECFNNATRTVQMWGQVSFIALGITMLLPLVYFGGKKVIKDSTDRIMRVKSLE